MSLTKNETDHKLMRKIKRPYKLLKYLTLSIPFGSPTANRKQQNLPFDSPTANAKKSKVAPNMLPQTSQTKCFTNPD